jgi:hypothetical protein
MEADAPTWNNGKFGSRIPRHQEPGLARPSTQAGGMDLLWPALGISIVVAFVFYVLANHWQRMLRQQSWMIRRLTERLRDVEEMSHPEFLRRLNEAAPSPLEQVFTFSFRLSDFFWRDVLNIQEEDLRFIRTTGSFPGSVKIERWRGHSVATVTEVLPESKSAGWQTRSLDLYSEGAKNGDGVILWEMPLVRPQGSAERPPSLELVIRDNSIDLCGHLLPGARPSENGLGGNGHVGIGHSDEITFFRVPLDAAHLAEFRSHDPLGEAKNGNGNSVGDQLKANGGSWQAFYSSEVEGQGIEWNLRVRDLCKKGEWEQWKVLESTPVSVLGEEK